MTVWIIHCPPKQAPCFSLLKSAKNKRLSAPAADSRMPIWLRLGKKALDRALRSAPDLRPAAGLGRRQHDIAKALELLDLYAAGLD